MVAAWLGEIIFAVCGLVAGLRRILGGRALAALAACALLTLTAAQAAPTAPDQFSVAVTIDGKGTILFVGGRRIVCAAFCRRTTLVRPGSKLAVIAQPGAGWKFSVWAGACRGTIPTCTLRVARPTSVRVKFIPPGARQNPIPLGKRARVRSNWAVRVVSVDADATQTVLAVTDSAGNHVNQPPPRGVQDFLVRLSVTYTGAGSGDISSLVNSLQTLGAHNVAYDVRDNPCGLLPPLDLASAGPVEVRSGDTVTGNVCFQIASNDARSLLLHAGDLLLKTDFWFALR